MILRFASKTILSTLAIGSFFLTGMTAEAFEVSPMRVEMQPSGSRASATFSVANQTSAELPIEVLVERRTFNEDGTSLAEPDLDNFIIFPEQFVLAPGTSRAVRLQYIGDPVLDQGAAYILKFNQVPVDMSEFGGGLQVVYSFGAAVYIEPAGARAALEVQAFRQTGTNVDLTVRNTGNRHANLSRGIMRIETDRGRVTFSGVDLSSRFPTPVLAPGQLRLATLNLPEVEHSRITSITFMPAEY